MHSCDLSNLIVISHVGTLIRFWHGIGRISQRYSLRDIAPTIVPSPTMVLILLYSAIPQNSTVQAISILDMPT